MSKHQGNGKDVDKRIALAGPHEPIAIVGIGCRFPGASSSPAQFWSNLRQGVDAISEVPEDRWSSAKFYDPAKGQPGKSQTRWGGFVENLDQFDPQFFGISPREAARMDPQQRMLLEVAWEAIEDAGVPAQQLSGSRTAVFVGVSSWDYAYLGLSYRDRGCIDAYSNTGGSLSIASNRISYCFDLRGPSASVDTACSSALLALHLACQSIWHNGCVMALSGGVNALLTPDFFVAFSQLGMLSPDGRCKTFDARANGFARGEGAGMVLLKPLSAAVADRDRIYAVIRGTAANQDGHTPGMTVPSQQSQEALLRSACSDAGIVPCDIQYVEAHGTGTQVGDPIETRALGNVLAAGRPADQPCLIGSVKTNIGHLEAGAGIASVIKVALALYHREVPQNLHFQQPNPAIDFTGLKLRVPVQCEAWPAYQDRALAGINGFGYGGTNAHVILEGLPATPAPVVRPRVRASWAESTPSSTPQRSWQLFPLSARSAGALTDTAQRMSDVLDQADDQLPLGVWAGHAAHRRSHHDHRLVVIARDRAHLTEQLTHFAAGESATDVVSGRCTASQPPQLTFVCSGQGPQWWGMGRGLLESEPVFRRVVERCDEVARQLGSWSLLEQLTCSEHQSRMHQTAIAQPAIFVVQAALGELWRSWGVEPARIVGHSVGEVAAAYLAGVYSLEEAYRIVFHRGRCMDLTGSDGRMLAVGLTREEAAQLIAPYGDQVGIAALNSPTSMTLSGAAGPLEEIATLLAQRQVFCRQLQVEYAFHSYQMDPARDALLEALHDIRPAQARIPLMSTVTGQWMEGPELDNEYWWQNVRHTVRFAGAIVQMADSTDAVLELSPHPVLAYSITECFQTAGKQAPVLSSLKREHPELRNMLQSLGQLHVLGQPINWQEIAPAPHEHVELPTYPWQRQQCWFESHDSRYSRFVPPVHPLLGVPQDAPQPGWQCRLDLHQFGYLADHRVQGMTIFPGAGYAELALAAACVHQGTTSCRVSHLELVNSCLLSADEATWMETRLNPSDRTLTIHSRLADAANDSSLWTLHATAECSSFAGAPTTSELDWDAIRQRCTEPFQGPACYQVLTELGLDYGPAFRGVREGWRRTGEALGVVQLPDAVCQPQAPHQHYLIHPALLDACFHITIPADADYDAERRSLYLPVTIGRLTLHRPAGARVLCHARILRKTANQVIADLDIYDEDRQLVLEVRGLTSQRVTGSQDSDNVEDLLYSYVWQPSELAASASADDTDVSAEPAARWLVFADQTGVGSALVAQLREEGHDVVTVSVGSRYTQQAADQFLIDPANREDMLRVLRSVLAGDQHCAGIVHLWSLDAPSASTLDTASLAAAQDAGVISALHLVQAWDELASDRSSRLLLVTHGAQSVQAEPESTSVAQSPLIGLGRVIVSEYPRLECRLVDLDPSRREDEARHLTDELLSQDSEDEVAWRGGTRFAHRFLPLRDQPQHVPAQSGPLPYRLEIQRGGTIDDLRLRTQARRAPGPGELEIAVSAAALNFSDVMKSLGLYPGLPDGPIALGAECAGTVARVGQGVTEFAVGDAVMAVASGAFASHVTVPAHLVAARPAELSDVEAATLPIAFLTASYALEQLARIRAGERVLVHSGSGGVGLAAIQLVQQRGAEVLATAGTPEKRQYLRERGIRHVMDSRSLDFADEVRHVTAGQGVDAVLNSLAGEAIPRGIEALAVGGRFLEIGKRDIYQNAHLHLMPFRNNLAFFAIDLDQLMRQQSERIGGLLRQLAARFTGPEGLQPLPHQTYSIDQVEEAFRFMQQGKHIGKIVITMTPHPSSLQWGDNANIRFPSDASYLVTGGLGGFGLALAQWLVDRGARHLALMGRRGVCSEQAERVVRQLEAAGATVEIVAADVAQPADAERALKTISSRLPPLRGVFHAAMVLEDALLVNLDREWMQRVMAPKVQGTWNLHALTRDMPLDCFVLFSSLSSVFGHAGQGNYAAANALLDCMTYYRRAEGLPCLTVNWGYLGDVGYLAERQQLGQRLERQGVLSFTIEQALSALETALQRDAVQLSVMRVDWSRWRGLGVTGTVSPRFAHLLPHRPATGGLVAGSLPSWESIRDAEGAVRTELVNLLLRDKIARLLGVDAEQLDGDTPLLDLGLDSLMAVEIRNWIESQLQVDLPVVQLMRSPGLARLVETLCDQVAQQSDGAGGDDAELPEQDAASPAADPQQLLENIDQLSGEQVDLLLATLLEEEALKQQETGPILRKGS